MSWISDLYETYENNKDLAGNTDNVKDILLPVAHGMQNAQIEIVIDREGEFQSAEVVSEDDAITIMPVTEDSETRSSNIAPHPLCDKLDYIAGDYLKYVDLPEKKQKSCQDKHSQYMTLLNNWSNSKYTHWKVQAIQTYLSKGTVIRDLVDYGVLKEIDGKLTKDKIEGIAQADTFVRFRVIGDIDDEEIEEVYKNKNLFKLYRQYYLNSRNKKELCYVTGNYVSYATKHPKYIRKAGDSAKLISSEDEKLNYKYKGRFENSMQVAVIGYEASQKANKALKWLIARQGFSVDEMYVTCWEMTGKPVPPLNKNTREALDIESDEDESTQLLNISANEDEETTPTVNDAYARQVKNLAVGYGNKYQLKDNENVVVMAVEAPVPGRLAVNYYRKLSGSKFLENVMNWHNVCAWQHYCKPKDKEKKGFWWIGAPSPREIATTAYGSKNTKLIKQTMERLLPCIVDGKSLPRDIMKAAVNRVSNFYSFESRDEYRTALAIACALVRKTEYDKEKRMNPFKEGVKWQVALDRENRDRSYVYGRLLGAAQKLEEDALKLKGEKGRETAAERFSLHFAKRPAKTWNTIDNALKPYKSYLKSRNETYALIELQKLYDLIAAEDFISNKPLSELYLLGYNCQLNSYYQKKEQSKDTEEDVENE